MGKDYINNNADVAVWMICFNQAAFIREAIESVMAQKTNFSFKLVIADDCSTDNTQEICENYVLKFPDKILYYRNKSNLGFSLNGQLNYERCYKISNKYIALLEGDDYWIDNEKLQKQYDLLESPLNQDYVICSTNYIEFYEDKKEFSEIWAYYQGINGIKKPRGSVFEIEKEDGWKTKTATVLFRKTALNLKKIFKYGLMVDSILIYELDKKGRKLFLNDLTAVYRLRKGGNWSLKTVEEKEIFTKRINAEIQRVNYMEEVIIKNISFLLVKIIKKIGSFNCI
jgi:glycosyltransferase involved in cell wall biosynthesis